jgi:hypothetical protein
VDASLKEAFSHICIFVAGKCVLALDALCVRVIKCRHLQKIDKAVQSVGKCERVGTDRVDRLKKDRWEEYYI